MKTYRIEELVHILHETGIRPGDLVSVHSSLFMLGRLEGYPVREAPRIIAETLISYLDEAGTLAVPAFNFGFCRGEPFDRQRTPSERMGQLSEYVRRLPQSIRSPHPMQSLAVVGRLAEAICSTDTPASFDPEGAFDQLIRHDAWLLLLGVDIQWASVAHYAEQKAEVPYRYWKSFRGTYIDQGVEEERTYTMFVRELGDGERPRPKLDFSIIGDTLKEEGLLRETMLGSGVVNVCRYRDLIRVAMKKLAEDPYCLVENAAEVRPWYA